MKELVIDSLNSLGFAYWVEIITKEPNCTYYFGPFLSKEEAQKAKGGYIEDLNSEAAQDIVVNVERCKPSQLTIFDELEEQAEIQSFAPLES